MRGEGGGPKGFCQGEVGIQNLDVDFGKGANSFRHPREEEILGERFRKWNSAARMRPLAK